MEIASSTGSIPPGYLPAHPASSVDEIVHGSPEENQEPEKKTVQIVVPQKVNAEVTEGGTVNILA